MPWWGFVLIGVLATLCAVLLIAFLTKKTQKGLTDEEKQKLIDSETEDLNKRLGAEKAEKVRLKAIMIEQIEAHKKLKRELKQQIIALVDWRKENVEKLLSDADLLSSELDKLATIELSDKEKPTTEGETE